MKSRRLLIISSLLLAASVCGCSDDDDDTSLYMSGSLNLSFERYVEIGFSKTFNVDTLLYVTLEDGTTDGIGYAYKLPLASSRDTIKTKDGEFTAKTFTVEAPDSLGNFSFYIAAFADGYYETTTSVSFTVVNSGLNGEKSTLTGYSLTGSEPKFTDARDGREYLYAEKGGLQWMRQNLAWQGAGVSFRGCSSPAVSTIFGRYYTWTEAQTACPDGWRLPSDKDWCSLASACGVSAKEGKDISGFAGNLMENLYFNGQRMWEYWRDVKIDNAAGLSVAPFGYMMTDGESFSYDGLGDYAVFWTSGESDGMGVYRYIYAEKNVFFNGITDKDSFGASVRCVREVPTS